MGVKSKYAEPIANYDPARHGTIKEYCENLGIDYLGFRKAAHEQRKRAGIRLREFTDYRPYYKELMETGEPIKTFCQRKGLDYNNFRISWYRYRKAHGIEIEKARNGRENLDDANEICADENSLDLQRDLEK